MTKQWLQVPEHRKPSPPCYSGESYSYEYDNRGNVTKETSVDDDGYTSTVEYTYDDMGNVTSVLADGEKSEYLYDTGGRTLLANENGECTRTLYDNLGRIVQEISPEDYDSTKDGLPSENTYADSNAGHRYVYNETTGNLDSETNRIGVTTDYTYYSTGEKKTESFDIYKYDYNIKGNLTKVYIDGVNTLSYNYDENYNLTSEVYANGQSIRYEYDDNGNCIMQYHNSDTLPYVTYTYNADNELTQKINTDTGLKHVYGENNKVEVFRISDNTLVQSYTEAVTEADEENGIEAKTEITENHFGVEYSSVIQDKSIKYTSASNSVEYSYETTEDTAEVLSDSVKFNDNIALSAEYTYDNNNVISKTVSFKQYKSDSDEQVSFVNEYDNDGKITASGYDDELYQFYTYDANDQIVRVDNNYTYYTSTYTYNSRGNATTKNIYDFTENSNITDSPIETTTFTYSNNGWKDQLVAINDVELTYDEVGNVLTYGDKSFTWNSGRNLESITDEKNTYSYTYDENGIRTSKTVNGDTIYFNTKDGVILSLSNSTYTMYFQYDANGIPLGFFINDIPFHYITNQMGDVIALTDYDGNVFAEYVYDEWGKLLDINTIDDGNWLALAFAEANPIRYRGYFYDNETGYYYLQSRYYDPNICRFINADDVHYTDVNSVCGLNIFAYCGNNPLNKADILGTNSSPNCWQILTRFLKYNLLKGKTIEKYTKMVKDSYNLYSVKVYYKKSKHNTNAFNITFGYRMAWKKNTTWLNNMGKNQKAIENYYNKINSVMTSSPPITQAQADKNIAQVISSNIGLGIQVIKSGFTASSMAKKYNKVWGKNGIDVDDKKKFILFWVTNESSLNGLYVYQYSNNYVRKI